jgi:uncharacterized protein YegP (UPF0339 family)
MATATTKAPATSQVVSGAGRRSERASTEFLIFEDNGGAYHWSIAAGNRGTLAQSGSFVSFDDAARAARDVRDAARSASFELHGGGTKKPEARASRQ